MIPLSKSGGKYILECPTFIDNPVKIDHFEKEYLFTIHEIDSPKKTFSFVASTIEEIYNRTKVFSDYGMDDIFHLFDRKDAYRKTLECGAVSIKDSMVDISLYTDWNVESSSVELLEGSSLKDLLMEHVKLK